MNRSAGVPSPHRAGQALVAQGVHGAWADEVDLQGFDQPFANANRGRYGRITLP